ncbi:MAG: hypothetical protein H0U42_01905 [Thermoleophilaceae bacterium]|nr:hypothetical protein [Thermoleophilaceae bacterium]
MNWRTSLVLIAVALMALAAPGCGFSVSTANISVAAMARDKAGADPTTTFAPDEPFYCVIQLSNAPDDTNVRALWTAVDTEAAEPGTVIDEAELTQGDGQIVFDLTNDRAWPTGKYEVQLFLNEGEAPAETLAFQVE